MIDANRRLRVYLAHRIPDLAPAFQEGETKQEWTYDNAYSMFDAVVRPYIESLLPERTGEALSRIWSTLEEIAQTWPGHVTNGLFLMMEDMERWKFHRFLGPSLTEDWMRELTWYPTMRTRTESMNDHVDAKQYRRRWLEEIHRCGGFGCLTDEQRNQIAVRLIAEFRIETLAT